MSITTARKAEVVKTYAVKSGDTGSPEVQVALLSAIRNGFVTLNEFSYVLLHTREYLRVHVRARHELEGRAVPVVLVRASGSGCRVQPKVCSVSWATTRK